MVRERYRQKKQGLIKDVAAVLSSLDKAMGENGKGDKGLEGKIRGFIEDVRSYAERRAEAIFGGRPHDIEEEKKEVPK